MFNRYTMYNKSIVNMMGYYVLRLVYSRGSSSVLFAYLFLLLFGQIDNIYKVEQDSLYFFVKGNSRAFI